MVILIIIIPVSSNLIDHINSFACIRVMLNLADRCSLMDMIFPEMRRSCRMKIQNIGTFMFSRNYKILHLKEPSKIKKGPYTQPIYYSECDR